MRDLKMLKKYENPLNNLRAKIHNLKTREVFSFLSFFNFQTDFNFSRF